MKKGEKKWRKAKVSAAMQPHKILLHSILHISSVGLRIVKSHGL